eukprot:gnl/Carplike_NY0171/5127_a6999_390.p1 GENE.gnl/Carplike_NY0171/5127_a6999_390~~gnl/Carplike_NY0171/5127_a6999_390.p1  ORF type:complete len:104 (-),score=33.77 gnl/Carplike_NY0171/5127_a6999_390:178-444(-)
MDDAEPVCLCACIQLLRLVEGVTVVMLLSALRERFSTVVHSSTRCVCERCVNVEIKERIVRVSFAFKESLGEDVVDFLIDSCHYCAEE